MEESGSLFPPASNITQLPSDSKAISYVVKYLAKAPEKREIKTPDGNGGESISYEYYQEKVINGDTVYEKYRPIEGRVWGCSDGVRECKPPVIALSERVEGFLDLMKGSSRFRYVEMDRAEVYVGNVLSSLREYDVWLWKLWRWHHLALFRWLYCGRSYPPSSIYDELGIALTELYR